MNNSGRLDYSRVEANPPHPSFKVDEEVACEASVVNYREQAAMMPT